MFDEAISNYHSDIKISPQDRDAMSDIKSLLAKLKISSYKKRKEYLINRGFSDQEIEMILGDLKTN